MLLLLQVSCGKPQDAERTKEIYDISARLSYISDTELEYAEGFSITNYDSGYALITISDGSRFLVIPNGQEVPVDLAEDIIPLKQPIDNIYLAATATMDMFIAIGGLEQIALSGTKEDGWYLEEAQSAMASGDIAYAGKYNAPDYELILDSDCSLAIESTMLLHCPEVKEELESLGIPVLIDHSSYESHPLGRTEWIKLYGVLAGREEEAERVFEEQRGRLESISDTEDSGKTVAFFYITSNGMVNVRKSGDYIPKMIELAGGSYIFSDLGDDKATASMNMQMEEFYAAAKDADYLIYNSTTQGEVLTKETLLQKSPLFTDFKAFNEGNVYCVERDFYQESVKNGNFIMDLNRMLHLEELGDVTFFYLSKIE
ncbi:MAG: ABC transporter substrate-binding protein [Butyrivibrio sp.]|nr:ABC transporter substrate-binding protein [Muribaculum sp.]MCM1553392.1 ABC transporter substrate-binding protein [Butyrivibrio sp.]